MGVYQDGHGGRSLNYEKILANLCCRGGIDKARNLIGVCGKKDLSHRKRERLARHKVALPAIGPNAL